MDNGTEERKSMDFGNIHQGEGKHIFLFKPSKKAY